MSSTLNEDKNYVKLAQFRKKWEPSLNDIKALLKTDFDVNYVFPLNSQVHDKSEWVGNSVLHFLAESKSDHKHLIAKLLMKHGADFNKKNQIGYTPVRLAFEKSKDTKITGPNRNLINILLSAHLTFNNRTNPSCPYGISHLHIACIVNNYTIVKFYLEAGVSVNKAINKNSTVFAGCTLLHLAMINENLDMVQLLLEYGAEPTCLNVDGETPLHLLMKKQISDISYRGDKEVRKTKLLNNESILDVLLKSMKDTFRPVDCLGFSMLHTCCIRNESFESVKLREFLQNGINVDLSVNLNSLLWPGYTPLHFAAHCNLEIVSLLLRNGANFLAKDANGITPLEICMNKYKPLEVSNLLNIQNNLGSIQFQNGKKLADVVATFETKDKLVNYLETTDVNNAIPTDSPLWPGFTILHLAVMLNQETNPFQVHLCLKHNVDITIQDANNMTALHLATYMKKRRCIVDILQFSDKVSANPVDNKNLSHFHIACAANNTRIVKIFLLEKVNVDLPIQADSSLKFFINMKECVTIPASSTPLHIAAAIGAPFLARLLLEHGADPFILDVDGFTWLHRAFARCDFKKFIPNFLSKPNKALEKNVFAPGGLSNLHIACYVGNVKAVEALLSCTTDINEPIRSESWEQIKFSKEMIGNTPLHLVGNNFQCSEKIVDLLLKKGADVRVKNEEGLNPFHMALKLSDNSSAIKRFVLEFDKQQKWPDELGLTRLHVACALNDTTLIKQLLEDGEDVNSQIKFDSPLWPSNTPLHVLLEINYYQINENVYLLLNHILKTIQNSAEVDRPLHGSAKRRKISSQPRKSRNLVIDKNGLSAFHVSCMGEDPVIIEKFIKSGIDINASTDYFASCNPGWTPMHFAVRHGNKSVLEVLLKYEADINLENSAGETPVYTAIRHQCKEKIKIFSRLSGIDIGTKNTFGQTIVDILIDNIDTINDDDFANFFKNGSGLEKIHTFTKIKLIQYVVVIFSQANFKSVIEHLPNLNVINAKGRNVIHEILLPNSRMNLFKLFRRTFDPFINCGLNVEILTDFGCELDHQDKEGKTPFHHTSRDDKQLFSTTILLNLGADINVTDIHGETPYTYALKRGAFYRLLCDKYQRMLDQLNAAGLYVNHLNKECRNKDRPLPNESYYLKQMKEMNEITNKSISLRYLLTEEMVLKFPFMSVYHRQDILKTFNSEKIMEKFSNWLPVFKLQKRKILKREKLKESATNALRNFLDPRLPLHCLESILKCLDNENWNNLILSKSKK